jgi:hypothetical protein
MALAEEANTVIKGYVEISEVSTGSDLGVSALLEIARPFFPSG